MAALTKEDIRKAFFDVLWCRSKIEEPKETYRVAVQSVSVVLQNDESSSHEKTSTNDATGEKHQPSTLSNYDLSKYVSHHPVDQHIEQSVGDPNAYWPSQRPMRINPRLVQLYEELRQKERQGESSSESSSTRGTTSTEGNEK